jgi:hypothetical protein
MTIPYRVSWAVLSKAHPPGTAKCLSVSGHLREIRRKTKADRNDETSNIFTPTTFIDVTATSTQPMPTVKTTTSTSSATSSATSQNSTQNSSHANSSDHKLAIGLGLGLGIPFLALMVFFCCSYRKISISIRIRAPEPPPPYTNQRPRPQLLPQARGVWNTTTEEQEISVLQGNKSKFL